MSGICVKLVSFYETSAVLHFFIFVFLFIFHGVGFKLMGYIAGLM
jgi:hypothetical protein